MIRIIEMNYGTIDAPKINLQLWSAFKTSAPSDSNGETLAWIIVIIAFPRLIPPFVIVP